MPTSNPTIILTSIFEWYVVRCEFLKHNHQKHVCLENIRLRAQHMLSILNFIVNMIWGDLYGHLMSTNFFNIE